MMKLKYVTFVFLVLLFSCELQEVRVDPVIEDSGTRLQFNSLGQLSEFIEDGKKQSMAEYGKKLRAFESKGFRSLMPIFDMRDEKRRKEYEAFRVDQQKRFYTSLYRSGQINARSVDEDVEMDEDELIADPYFAALLNTEREIQVNDVIYKYTVGGLLYSSSTNYPLLKEAAQEIENEGAVVKPRKGVTLLKPYPEEAYAARCVDPEPRCAPPATVEPNPDPTTGSSTPPPAPLSKEDYKNKMKVCNWDPNLWDNIFGPAESCHDYFESDKRIKTKAWSQNYFIFASIGLKVKSQNRFLRIWWADDIAEIELGYSSVYFEYKIPTPSWPTNSFEYKYEYGDYLINQYGQIVGSSAGGPRSFFAEFPIKDKDKKIITIYLFQPLEKILNKSSLDLTAKDVNNAVESLAKSAFNTVSNTLKKTINGESAVIVYPNAEGSKLKFLYTNWSDNNKNDNKISNTFDWNTATIGFSNTGYNPGNTSPIYNSPRSYDQFKIICYGMGRRGSTWRGSKVVLYEKK